MRLVFIKKANTFFWSLIIAAVAIAVSIFLLYDKSQPSEYKYLFLLPMCFAILNIVFCDLYCAEGNLGMANAILEHLATKLPVSRLQRDLTDSTVLRNVGVPMAHIEIAFKSMLKGLGKLLLNEKALYADLDNCWAVVAEGIQTILRREGYPKPYEALKALTRTNEGITQQSISDFIDTLQVSDAVKAELKAITPHNSTGM